MTTATSGPTEHTEADIVDLNAMSEEAMIADAMGTPLAEPTTATPPTEPVVPAAEGTPAAVEPSDDLAASLLSALGEQAGEQPAAEPTTDPAAENPPVNAEKLKELDALFENTLGVKISDAVERMTSFAQESEATIARIQEAETRLALRMQEFELKQTWATDPSVQGQDINQVVQDRLATLAPIYSRLPKDVQDRLASAGSRGVIVLWEQTQAKRNPGPSQATPTGRAAIAPTPAPNGVGTLSEVIGLKDDDAYWRAIAANSQARNLTDDIGARGSRR